MERTHFADATFVHDGQAIAYWRNRDLSETIPLLMLHGWGANSSLMLPLAEKLAARGHALIIQTCRALALQPLCRVHGGSRNMQRQRLPFSTSAASNGYIYLGILSAVV